MQTFKCFLGALIAAGAVLLPLRAPAATNYYVATNGPHIPPYDDWSKAATNVQDVIARARNGDRIDFSNGTFVITGEISVAYSLTVRGAYGPNQTILTSAFPDYSNRCFSINNHGAWVDSLTISNFHMDGNGGGVYLQRGNMTNCVITHNQTIGQTRWGGGLYAHTGWTGLVTHCRVSCNINTQQFGGGIGIGSSANGVLRCCDINSNTGFNGGGVFFNCGLIDQCVIRDNVCSGNPGGGVGCSAGVGTNVILRNSLIMGNVAASSGGGVYKASNSFSVVNCTIVSNAAPTAGGLSLPADNNPDRRMIFNCVVFSNQTKSGVSSDIYLQYPEQQTNWFFNCCVGTYAGAYELAAHQGNFQADPQFVNPDQAAPDYHLLPGSPCINSGTVHHKLGDYDLDGMRRIDRFSCVIDMGCYEVMPAGNVFQLR